MKTENNNFFSQTVSVFQNRALPTQDITLAGYAAFIHIYDLKVPLPETLFCISSQHRHKKTQGWEIYPLRYKPSETLGGHLTFALKYEGLDLAVLNALFKKINLKDLETWIRSEPLGRYSRRIWFIYEWLRNEKLNIPDLKTGNFFDIVDTKLQFGGIPESSSRHRIRNNLTGTVNFCPLVRRTPKLDRFISLNLSSIAHTKTGSMHPDVLSRAAAFLLLKDSRASFSIEGETPPKNRTERWGRAIAQAGLRPFSLDELLYLQKIVIEDQRFVELGLRKEGGFIGVHERSTQTPLPDHISARWQDLPKLMDGMIDTCEPPRAYARGITST